MASKFKLSKSNFMIEKSLMDDFFLTPDIVLFPKAGLSAETFLEEEPVSSFLDEGTPLSYLKDFFWPSAPPETWTNTLTAVGFGRKKKLLKIFFISGGGIALLLLTLRVGNYLFNNYPQPAQGSTAVSEINLPPKKPIVPISSQLESSRESALFTIPPPPPPKPAHLVKQGSGNDLAPVERKAPKPRSRAKKVKAISPPKSKKKPQAVVTNKKVEKDAERVYQLYINRKYIIEETRAISLKLSLLGIENRIVKRKDGGYTICAGDFEELSKARRVREKVREAGYQAGIYSVVKN
jgi:hypothetical protein